MPIMKIRALVPLAVSLSLVSPSPAASTMRGTWFWKSASSPWGSINVVGDAAKEASVRANFVSNGISHVYGSYGNRPVTETAVIASWNTSLNNLGISNELLLAENSWINPTNHASMNSKIQSRVLGFNAAVAPSARFSGVHLDIEPQALATWSGLTPTEKRDHLLMLRDTYTAARNYLDNHGGATISLAADLPVWLDSSPSIGWDDDAERDAWYNDISATLDSITLMPFDRDTFSSIDSGVSWELANITGADVRVGLEVDIPGTWSNIDEFFDMADEIETAYGETRGIDIQSYAKFAEHTVAVPEPATSLCGLLAAAAMVFRRKKD